MSKVGDRILYAGNAKGLQQWAPYIGRKGEVTSVDQFGNVTGVRWDDGKQWPTRPKEWNVLVVDARTPLDKLIEARAARDKARNQRIAALTEEERAEAVLLRAKNEFTAWMAQQVEERMK